MTVALPTRPARHRLAEHGGMYVLVTPPRDHRPTRHRRRRTELLQVSVRDLTPVHSPVRPTLHRRVASFLGRWLTNVVESGGGRG